MSDFPPLAAPWSRVALVHDTTDLFDPETMIALDARYRYSGYLPDADLNTLRAPGRYTVANPSNGPAGSAGELWYVDVATGGSGWTKQQITHFSDVTRTHIRVETVGGGWQTWRRLAFV